MDKRPTAIDVAEHLMEIHGELRSMTLHKATFYCQAYSLAWVEQPLFDDEIIASVTGPHIPALATELRRVRELRRSPESQREDLYTEGELDADTSRLNGLQRALIESISTQLNMDWGYSLGLRSMRPGEVWERFFIDTDVVHDRVITHQAMRRVYAEPHRSR